MMTLDEAIQNLASAQWAQPGDTTLLYGSYARGDFTASSDFDFLRITKTRQHHVRIADRISVHTYALKDLEEQAARGSLFVLHLASEALPALGPGSPLHKGRRRVPQAALVHGLVAGGHDNRDAASRCR
jgi:hypothetical protein